MKREWLGTLPNLRKVYGLVVLAIVALFLRMIYIRHPISLHSLAYGKPFAKQDLISGKLILFWTRFFEAEDFYVGFGSKPFNSCPVNSCWTTNDRSLLNRSDAVIFHIRDIDLSDLPKQNYPNQRWIFFLLESPENTPYILKQLSNMFNWTMTYRIDSDIYAPYSSLEAKEQNNIAIEEDERKSLLRGKRKLIAWFVSNCVTSSGRERYVSELQKYIDVDIYGTCGPLECFDRLQCYKTMQKDYKFYLAFENSLCRDYITEKFYNSLLFKTVPIVYGGANYSKIAPKDSFIDVRDYPSAKELAQYLKYLEKNTTAYASYFDWHKMPSGLANSLQHYNSWCKLCSMLNNASLPTKSYSDIHSWWFDKGECGKDTAIFEKLTSG